MQARKSLLSVILVVSALAGLASTAPSSSNNLATTNPESETPGQNAGSNLHKKRSSDPPVADDPSKKPDVPKPPQKRSSDPPAADDPNKKPDTPKPPQKRSSDPPAADDPSKKGDGSVKPPQKRSADNKAADSVIQNTPQFNSAEGADGNKKAAPATSDLHAVVQAKRNEPGPPADDDKKKTPNAVHQLACDGSAKTDSATAGDSNKATTAVHQLACDGGGAAKTDAAAATTTGGADTTKPAN